MKKFFHNFLLVLASLTFCFLLLEIGLRFLPVKTGLQIQAVNENDPVFHATPNIDYTYSNGWSFKIPNTGHVNSDGFVNDQDYDASATTPLMAVIGDSFIESLMVPYDKTIQGRLAQSVKNTGRVYSFAFSGAPLSQYLIWAQYAQAKFKPDIMSFVIISNDFDESLLKYKKAPGFHYFDQNKLRRIDYTPGFLRTIVNSSAVFRYLVYNMHIHKTIAAGLRLLPTDFYQSLKSLFISKEEKSPSDTLSRIFENNVPVTVSAEKSTDAQRAIDLFLGNVVEYSGLPAEKIVFIIDALRARIYQNQPQSNKGYAASMFAYFKQQAQAKGFNVIDTDPYFRLDYQKNKTQFDFLPFDAHWNDHAHGVIATAVKQHPLIQSTFFTDK
ncbi:conserved exported hypothetical protein [Candidatus Terasakiella magnetica]|uniref:AlgX/AlgJ SGNH hydrolase-like domain-containing protein n=1 Tax=Candidatus Terasakiella magnetica TaxID=1867952 RepID=A0A1C3RG69_9PROT|nr:hypothetical protein [Candidatus Terasakiella magnetica]SCA56255.1 conserved exported hypothetical protein [Candidatus Terasakiella magnetica]